MEDRGEVLYELSPKFDFFYELTMPTGKKMKSALSGVIISAIVNILMLVFRNEIMSLNKPIYATMYGALQIILLIILIFLVMMFVSRIVMQCMEYKGIKYKFCKDCMIYENNFLNQTKKTIEYSNIKEIEIRRSITDRVLNYGIIIIYTNAEKIRGGATVIYAIKNAEEHYKNIENIVHNGTIASSPIKTGDTERDIKESIDLQNAMERNEVYNETTATSDNNPLDENDE